jgi:threonine aldolase
LYALDHHMDQLAVDHANARLIAERLSRSPAFSIDLATVQTNIVIFDLSPDAPDAAAMVSRAASDGVRLFAFGPRTLRVVTHMNVSRIQCATAAETLVSLAEASPTPTAES